MGSPGRVGASALLLLLAGQARARGFGAIARDFSRTAARQGVERIAVLPFAPADGESPAEGWVLSERLVTPLVRQGRVKTVERGLLEKVLDEQRLARTGLVDPGSVRRLGRMLAADAVVTGSFVARDGEASVNARLIHVETGVILAAREELVRRDWRAEPRPAARDRECLEAPEKVDRLQAAVMDLKARYWARKLEDGTFGPDLARHAAAIISDRRLRRDLDRRIASYRRGGGPEPLSEEEVRRFLSSDGEAFFLAASCGINNPR